MTCLRLAAAALLALAALPAERALASSPDAWADMRKSVEAACLKAAAPLLPAAKARVDPFGSESYGLAVLTGTPKGGTQPAMLICVYDKRSGKTEVGTELPLPR